MIITVGNTKGGVGKTTGTAIRSNERSAFTTNQDDSYGWSTLRDL